MPFSCSKKTPLEGFSSSNDASNSTIAVVDGFQFSGYTSYWQDIYQYRYRYGNLLRMNIPNVDASVRQAKADIAEALHIPGLQLQEGFIQDLITKDGKYKFLGNPSLEDLNKSIGKDDLLVYADTTSNTGKELMQKAYEVFKGNHIGHQVKAKDYSNLYAFILKKRNQSIFAVVGDSQDQLELFRTLLGNTLQLVAENDLKRGWFGVQTLIKSVTCTPGTPIDVVGTGLNEGNSWFVFDGYMEFLARKEIDGWISESGLPIVADVGFPPIYNCSDYDDLQVQLMFNPQDWIEYAKSKNGYVFRQVYDNQADNYPYSGYYANKGNARQINNEKKPFVLQTGELLSGATSHMVLFNKKGESFNKAQLWNAIMERRAVAITEGGFMMGDEYYRNALQLLFLDRVHLEEYFGDRISLETKTEGNQILLAITNRNAHRVKGRLIINLPKQLSFDEKDTMDLDLPAGESKVLTYNIKPTAGAMNRRNVIAFTFNWGEQYSKSTVAQLELPPAISVHKLLYGPMPNIKFPVSVHNFSDQDSVAVEIRVTEMFEPSNPVLETEKNVRINTGDYADIEFDLQLSAGNYLVTTSALGVSETTQIGIEKSQGNASVEEVDLNNDGIPEYIMENGQVKVTLLTTGARVIEYIVKKKNDNVLFKLWPQKPDDDSRPFREHGFYPYGGFEDFLGQPSIETHKKYKATIEKKEGNHVQVRMTADYYGNSIEKIYTLYGNTPLLEVRFALKMTNPELNMFGPQPIYEIGKTHGPEDIFFVPEMDGIHEYRMSTDRYFGKKFDLSEGWNAGYDTLEDISLVSAYPVSQPIFLHMWMNHPSNPDAHFFYAEFQPWTPLHSRTTTYFSYYMWADAGNWKKALEELKNRNLITIRK